MSVDQLLVLVLPVALAFAVTFGLRAAYRRAVLWSMRARAGASVGPRRVELQPATAPPQGIRVDDRPPRSPADLGGPARELVERARSLRAATGWLYLGAGAVHAALTSVLLLAYVEAGSDQPIEPTPLRLIVVALVLMWPVIPTAGLILSPRLRGSVAGTMLIALLMSAAFLAVAYVSVGALRESRSLPTMVVLVLVQLVVISAVVFGASVGYLALVGRLRRRARASSQMVVARSFWLLNTVVVTVLGLVASPRALALVLPYVVYRVVVRLGFAALARRSGGEPQVRLLLLRVFGARARAERLLAALEHHWATLGAIRLIAGTDLATATMDPEELMDLLTGRLAARFVRGGQDLEGRLASLAASPSRDGRYPVEELFCHDDTWRAALVRLVRESDVALMDLRGFSPANAGCAYELGELMSAVPTARVALLVDATTDMQALRVTLESAWTHMRPDSPNRREEAAPIRLLRVSGDGVADVPTVVAELAAAAAGGRQVCT